MKPITNQLRPFWPAGLFLTLVASSFLAATPVQAQRHRATRLGDPSGRFAPPLTRPEQTRALFADEKLKADVVSILNQAGWKGDVEDLRRAAASAPITELRLPTGSRLPYMSSRRNGKPVALIDVLWAGKEPIEAYAFDFTSKGRRYRCIVPRPCSNFYTVDLGPEPKAALQLTLNAAPASACAPFEFKATVRNTGNAPARQVRVTGTLPDGLKTSDHQTALSMDAGELKPGTGMEFRMKLVAPAPGKFTARLRADSAEGKSAEAGTAIAVRAPALALACHAPAEVLSGRAVEVCLTVRNTGDSPEPRAAIQLPLPVGATFSSATDGGVFADGRVAWEIVNLAPQSEKRVCAILNAGPPGSLAIAPSVRGDCAPPAQSQCSTRVAGIPAILLEVIDLEDPIEVGGEVTYDIRVLNQGSAPGTNIKLVCTLPEEQEFVSGSGITPVQSKERTITMEPLPSLAPKATASWRVVVKAARAGDARFKVDLASDQFQQPIQEYESTQQH